jgi:hypothetical protein
MAAGDVRRHHARRTCEVERDQPTRRPRGESVPAAWQEMDGCRGAGQCRVQASGTNAQRAHEVESKGRRQRLPPLVQAPLSRSGRIDGVRVTTSNATSLGPWSTVVRCIAANRLVSQRCGKSLRCAKRFQVERVETVVGGWRRAAHARSNCKGAKYLDRQVALSSTSMVLRPPGPHR